MANAGVQHVAPVREFPEDRWDQILAILLAARFLLAKYAWDALAATQGSFIAVASAHALVASPYKAAYVSAKHGVLGLIKTLALEGGEARITATAVCPGYVRTPLHRGPARGPGEGAPTCPRTRCSSRSSSRRTRSSDSWPDEVAGVIAFLAGPSGGAFSGVPVTMDLGWSARWIAGHR